MFISNDNESFTFYVDVFFPLTTPSLIPDLIKQCIYDGCLIRSWLPFTSLRVHIRFLLVSVLLIFLVCFCPIMCLYVLRSVLWHRRYPTVDSDTFLSLHHPWVKSLVNIRHEYSKFRINQSKSRL